MTDTAEAVTPVESLAPVAPFIPSTLGATDVDAADAAGVARADAAGAAEAVVRRLARTQALPDAVLAALRGPLGEAIATAGDYATGSLSQATRRAYTRDW